MKKSFAFIFVLIISVAMSCENNGQWKYYHIDKDELKGTESYDNSTYTSSNGDSFWCCSHEDYAFISLDRGIFDYDFKTQCISVIVGFYEGKTLIEKCSTEFLVLQKGNTAMSTDLLSPELGKKIIKHLKTKGNVRIIASKYSGSDFDITIPKNPNIKTSIL